MTKIISHNTFSYLPVRQWWLRPFAWMARCQDKDIDAQMKIADGIDIRVRFDEDEIPHFAHGLIEYEGEVHSLLAKLDMKAWGYDRCYIARIMLETTPFMTRYKRARQKELFWKFCKNIEFVFPRFDFYGGWPRDEWRQKVYNFRAKEPSVTEMHGSVSGNKLNCLRLKVWARQHNHEIIENAKTEYVMIDFVEFQ